VFLSQLLSKVTVTSCMQL